MKVLGVDRTTSQQEMKRAVYKMALWLHPDKNPGDEVGLNSNLFPLGKLSVMYLKSELLDSRKPRKKFSNCRR